MGVFWQLKKVDLQAIGQIQVALATAKPNVTANGLQFALHLCDR